MHLVHLVRLAPILGLGLALACSSAGGGAENTAGGPRGDAPTDDPGSPPPGTGGPGAPAPEGDPRAACKRGVAYGYHSDADMRALSKGVSWWYNWAHRPDEGVRDTYTAIGLEYVPMVWGGSFDDAAVASQAPTTSRTLLGFNEPNFHEQANLSAAQAAALWPRVQAIADARGLYLVSPAVNFCGGGCQDEDPFAYLDDFFAACPGCRVDAIGVHLYVGCAGDGDNHARWLINHLKTFEERFPQPIWLTEFACHDAASVEEQRAFMVDAVTHLEGDPRVERYAWFAGRADNVAHVDLLGADGELTVLGQTYVDLPHADGCSM